MLRLTTQNGYLAYANGFNACPPSVTRYSGERWEQIGPDLLCGIADVFPDVGIVTVGRSSVREVGSVKYCNIGEDAARTPQRWAPIDAGDIRHKAVYSLSEECGELYVPDCREAVEDVSSWTVFAPAQDEGYSSFAFLGNRAFRDDLSSRTWNVRNGDLASFVDERCRAQALFQMRWSPGEWILFPGRVELNDLVALADATVAQINAELTD